MIFMRRVLYLVVLAAVAGGSLHYYRTTLAAREADYRESERNIEERQAALEELRAEVEQVRARVRGLDSDSLEVEAAIRRNKRLVREGEVVYRIEATNAQAGLMPIEPSESEFAPELTGSSPDEAHEQP